MREDDQDTLAIVSYSVDKNGEIHINVELDSFGTESVDGLASLLTTLSMDSSYLQTVQMVQESFQNQSQEDLLMRIYAHLAANPNEKAVRIHREKTKSKPCIKPSDML